MLQRPIYGGVFGHWLCSLATLPRSSNGLRAVRFMVIEPRGDVVISTADDKLVAIEAARRVLRLAKRDRTALEFITRET